MINAQTPQAKRIEVDRMRFTKNRISSRLVILAILFNAVCFISIYKSDRGSYYYNSLTGLSIIYNLVFMLLAFLSSEGVKSRDPHYPPLLAAIGIIQIARIFILPMRAHQDMIKLEGAMVPAMGDAQFVLVILCLVLSALCCMAAAVTAFIQDRRLAEHLRFMGVKSA